MSTAFLKKFIFGNKNRLGGVRSKKLFGRLGGRVGKFIWSTRGGGGGPMKGGKLKENFSKMHGDFDKTKKNFVP